MKKWDDDLRHEPRKTKSHRKTKGLAHTPTPPLLPHLLTPSDSDDESRATAATTETHLKYDR